MSAILRWRASKKYYILFNSIIKELKSYVRNLRPVCPRRSWWYYYRVPAWRHKHANCVYCHRYRRMTREHLLPAVYGGTYCPSVCCRECNEIRGHSLTWPPFISYCRKYPVEFARALLSYRCENPQDRQ